MQKVSIITIAYNEATYIEQTLRSVIEQDYKNIEYIVIDGGSTDGTVEIIQKYKTNIAYFVSEKDGGIYQAMNKGLRFATGNIIGIMNAGDWYEHNKVISRAVEEIEKNNVDGVYSGTNSVDGETVLRKHNPKLYETMCYSITGCHEGFFIKKSFYDKCGLYDTTYSICADYDLLLRMYLAGAIFIPVEEIWVNFRTGGISSTYFLCAKERVAIIKKYLHLMPNKDFVEKKMLEIVVNTKAQIVIEQTPTKVASLLHNMGFSQNLQNNVIWGTGVWGKKMANVFAQCNVPLAYFVDSNNAKHGSSFCNCIINAPAMLKNFNGHLFVAVVDHDEEIKALIESINPALLLHTVFLSDFKTNCAKLYEGEEI